MQTLEYHGNEVFLCYTHAPPEAKVSLTENINIHAFGCELNGLKFSCVEFGERLKICRLLLKNKMQQKNSIRTCRIEHNLLFTCGLCTLFMTLSL